jgi:hypothetical protein
VLTAETSTAIPPADLPDFQYPPLPWVSAAVGNDRLPPDPAPRPVRRRPWRSVVSALLAASSIACLVVGNVALWMRQDLYSARAVGQEAQQIMGSSDVQQAVANMLVTGVVQPALDHAGLGPLTGVVSAPVMGIARRAIDDAVASQPAQHVASRLVEQVVPQLDKGTGPVALSPEQLAWIVSPSLASNRLVADALRTADRTGCCRMVLVQRGHLSFTWRHVRDIRTAGLVLPPLALAFAALAVVVSRRRVRMAMILAGATAAAGLATFASLWAGPGFWANLTSHAGPAAGVVRAAQRTVFDWATAGLRQHSLWIAAAGGVALAALVGGRLLTSSRASRASRAAITP